MINVLIHTLVLCLVVLLLASLFHVIEWMYILIKHNISSKNTDPVNQRQEMQAKLQASIQHVTNQRDLCLLMYENSVIEEQKNNFLIRVEKLDAFIIKLTQIQTSL